jgi:hypothetical protein
MKPETAINLAGILTNVKHERMDSDVIDAAGRSSIELFRNLSF